MCIFIVHVCVSALYAEQIAGQPPPPLPLLERCIALLGPSSGPHCCLHSRCYCRHGLFQCCRRRWPPPQGEPPPRPTAPDQPGPQWPPQPAGHHANAHAFPASDIIRLGQSCWGKTTNTHGKGKNYRQRLPDPEETRLQVYTATSIRTLSPVPPTNWPASRTPGRVGPYPG